MAQKFTVPITVKQLTSAGSDAITVYVDADTYARLKVEAGGRLVWGSGSGVGDVNLYRDAADVLRTDDTFKTPTLFVDNIEIDPTGAQTDYVLKYDGTKFTAASASFGGGGATNLDGLTDVVITSPEEFQGLSYNGTSWVNSHIPLVSYVRNAEATTLTTGTAVYLFGATGDHATVKRADNTSDTTSSKTIGLVGANIAASQNGPIVTRGYVDGIDLSVGYSPGDILWLGTNGAFTKTKPTAPDHLVFIGVVVRATNNGIVYVATQNGYELDELHNVSASSPSTGDFLKYNGSLWVNDAINLGTDTVGNYMSDVTAGSGISVTHTPGEGSSATIANSGVLSVNGSTGAITGVVTTADTGTVTSTMIADGTIVDADINASAAVAHSKLANITAGSVLMGNATNVPTATALSGDVTINSSGVTAIGSGVIVNADINASAGISATKIAGTAVTRADVATVNSSMIVNNTIVNNDISLTAGIFLSKLESGTSGQVVIANASGVPTYNTVSGDVTISNAGVTAIGSGVIVDADVNASAAIALSKLASGTAGQVVLGNATGVPTYTSLSGDVTVNSSGVTAIGSGVIVDADINSAAAIGLSKLSTTGASSGYVISYNGTSWAASQLSNNSYNLDGGTASSTYGGITSLDGGTA